MEATMRNFIMAAAKVQDSRAFGVLLQIRKGITSNETKTAKKGFMEWMISID